VGVTGPVSERIVFLSASEATISAEETFAEVSRARRTSKPLTKRIK
jgi:hypothetical protein